MTAVLSTAVGTIECRARTLEGSDEPAYAVHASVAGLVVAVAAPPLAAMPVSDGIEKNVFSHAAGAALVIDESLVKVTVNVPLAATVNGVVNVCALPDVPVEKFHRTKLVDELQPV